MKRAHPLVSIFSQHGYLLGRAPLACLYAWQQASFAIGPNGRQWNKRRPIPPDDDYARPLDPNGDDAGKGGGV